MSTWLPRRRRWLRQLWRPRRLRQWTLAPSPFCWAAPLRRSWRRRSGNRRSLRHALEPWAPLLGGIPRLLPGRGRRGGKRRLLETPHTLGVAVLVVPAKYVVNLTVLSLWLPGDARRGERGGRLGIPPPILGAIFSRVVVAILDCFLRALRIWQSVMVVGCCLRHAAHPWTCSSRCMSSSRAVHGRVLCSLLDGSFSGLRRASEDLPLYLSRDTAAEFGLPCPCAEVPRNVCRNFQSGSWCRSLRFHEIVGMIRRVGTNLQRTVERRRPCGHGSCLRERIRCAQWRRVQTFQHSVAHRPQVWSHDGKDDLDVVLVVRSVCSSSVPQLCIQQRTVHRMFLCVVSTTARMTLTLTLAGCACGADRRFSDEILEEVLGAQSAFIDAQWRRLPTFAWVPQERIRNAQRSSLSTSQYPGLPRRGRRSSGTCAAPAFCGLRMFRRGWPRWPAPAGAGCRGRGRHMPSVGCAFFFRGHVHMDMAHLGAGLTRVLEPRARRQSNVKTTTTTPPHHHHHPPTTSPGFCVDVELSTHGG